MSNIVRLPAYRDTVAAQLRAHRRMLRWWLLLDALLAIAAWVLVIGGIAAVPPLARWLGL